MQLYNSKGEKSKVDGLFKLIVMTLGTGASFLIGDWHVSLSILLVFMCADFITGIMKGAYLGKLRSAVGYKGIIRKSGIMVVVILAHMLDLLVGNGMPVFRTMATFFFIGNEAISITENLGQMGIKIPQGIKKKFEQLANEEAINNNNMKQ